MKYETLIRVLSAVLITALGIGLMRSQPQVLNLNWAYIIGSTLALIFAIYLYRRYFGWFKFKIDLSIWKKYLKLSWPLASATIFYGLYHSLDSILLGFYGLISQNGLYNAVYKIMDMSILPVVLISSAFFPTLSMFQQPETDRVKIKNVFRLNFIWSLICALPICTICLVFAEPIVILIYGQAYLAAVAAFRILMIAALVIYLSYPFYSLLIANNQQKVVCGISATGVLLNLILNLVFIPLWGFYGCAIVTVITYLWDLILSVYFAKRILGF